MATVKLPYTYKLKKALNDGTTEIKELQITARPSAGVFMGMNVVAPTTTDFMRVMSAMFHQPMNVIKQMDGADMIELSGVISDFLAPD